MRREHRSAEVRQIDDGGRTFRARAVTYGIIDDYGTRFMPGCFADSLAERLPVIAWAHSWDDPIGRCVDYIDSADGLDIVGHLDDPDAVPRARQAIAQLRSGTITDVSVGFMRTADRTGSDGVTEITGATLDEVSLVLRGAVPGARVLSVRDGAQIPASLAADLLARLGAGSIDLHEALTEAKAAAAGTVTATADDPPVPVEEVAEALEVTAVDELEYLDW